ncbi:hypothetical protein FQR65_LT07941 [Abscondita terminalis]|nr:hypothetical protein FQR65_LT07941 [Abscondita terminalis]
MDKNHAYDEIEEIKDSNGFNKSSKKDLVQKFSIEEQSLSSTEHLVVEVDVHENAEDENFILNKFLRDSNQLRDFNKPDTDSSLTSSETRKLKANNSPVNEIDEACTKVSVQYSYEQIIGIMIHKTDRLKLDMLIIHPMVKVHIVNIDSGEYLLKSDLNRSVAFYYENKEIPYIMPILSEPYHLHKKRLVCPEWGEMILLNEDINHVVYKNTIIFFEIVDFVSYAIVVAQTNKRGLSQGWHKIAWAFIKPVGKNGESNKNQQLRLQLFYPHKYNKVSSNECPIFHWWKNKKFNKYPSTLYVTLKAVGPPKNAPDTLRSKTPVQGETGTAPLFKPESDLILTKKDSVSTDVNSMPKASWSRLKYQTCKIPNTWVADLQSFDDGCYVMKFSHSGLYLACAVMIDDIYSIIIYSVSTYEEVYRYSIHQALIYDIIWSQKDEKIMTSSADCTVSIWDFEKRSLIAMLPHPSHVYSSDINKSEIIATGCYDLTVRIWYPLSATTYDLVHELEGHKGYVTSVCFSRKSDLLYSADSDGLVIEWRYTSRDNWFSKRVLNWVDLRGTVINQIVLHKRERRLLVHARDSSLRLADLKTGSILQWFQGATNNRFRTMCCFSACGTYVFTGGEFNYVSVWNVDLGRLVASYSPYSSVVAKNVTVHCVQFHPHDNILVMSHYGHKLPILVAAYGANTDFSNRLGFRMVERNDDETVSSAGKRTAIPIYAISMILILEPIYMLYLFYGKYTKKGFIKFWEILPLFKGVAWTVTIYLIIVELFNMSLSSLALINMKALLYETDSWRYCNVTDNSTHCWIPNPKHNFTTNCRKEGPVKFSFVNRFLPNIRLNNYELKLDDFAKMNSSWVVSLIFTYCLISILLSREPKEFCKILTPIIKFTSCITIIPTLIVMLVYRTSEGVPSTLSRQILSMFQPGVSRSYLPRDAVPYEIALGIVILKQLHILIILMWHSTALNIIKTTYKIVYLNCLRISGLELMFGIFPEAIRIALPFPTFFTICWFFLLWFYPMTSTLFTYNAVIESLIDVRPKWSKNRKTLILLFCVTCFLCNVALLNPSFNVILTVFEETIDVKISYILFALVCITISIYTTKVISDDFYFANKKNMSPFWTRALNSLSLITVIIFSYQLKDFLNVFDHSPKVLVYSVMTFLLMPALLIAIIDYLKSMKTGELVGFKPSAKWGPRNSISKRARKNLNRPEEFYYNSPVECNHNCLLNSDNLQFEKKTLLRNKYKLLSYLERKDKNV